mgnify:CR=1 FL=1
MACMARVPWAMMSPLETGVYLVRHAALPDVGEGRGGVAAALVECRPQRVLCL